MSRNLEIINPISVCLIGDPGSTIKMCKVRGEAKMLTVTSWRVCLKWRRPDSIGFLFSMSHVE